MGLTKSSVGRKVVDSGLILKKQSTGDKVVAIAGNPNVGKSTLFNNLTGLNQHTGNWPGKTVSNIQGYGKSEQNNFIFVDIPGTYSLMAHSVEEEVARNFICFGKPDAVVVVCDATCLERNLNLVLQTIEIAPRVLVCVNLMDEAKKKKIQINLEGLSKELGVPVVGTTARKKGSLQKFLGALDILVEEERQSEMPECISYAQLIKEETQSEVQRCVAYKQPIEDAIQVLQPVVEEVVKGKINARWVSLRLLEEQSSLIKELNDYLGFDILEHPMVIQARADAQAILLENKIGMEQLQDEIVESIVKTAENIAEETVIVPNQNYNARDRKIDQILTSRWFGYPLMIALLALVFWITIVGANYPSKLLETGLFWIGEKFSDVLFAIGAPLWFNEMLVLGIYRVLAWVVSVMLPPMAIFFPLFTLLEDVGYLPRVAYNLDKHFKRCCACGKQALTMCMGFGCNAAGIVGCRIIDSPRERLIAMITNNFVPCNGRFPTLIAIITMFFVMQGNHNWSSAISALLLTSIIVFGILMTFLVSKILSKTILKGVPSSFTLELPSYRRPQIGKVIVHSIFDRTLFVLGRAMIIAAPAGLIIWILANISIGDISLLGYCTGFLDPFARILGLDGVILMAFILGLPANEIVVPIIIMAYMGNGSITSFESLDSLKMLLVQNGWTWITAVSLMLFSLMHWPCSTTLLTIRKETGSWKWTAVSFLIPTIAGILVCSFFTFVARLVIG